MKKHEYPTTHRLDDREKANVWQAISTPFAAARNGRARRRVSPALAAAGLACAAIAVALLANWPQQATRPLAGRDPVPVRSAETTVVPPPETAPDRPAPAPSTAAPLRGDAAAAKPAEVGKDAPATGESATGASDAPSGEVAQALDETAVEAAMDAVETRSVTASSKISSETFEQYAIDSVDEPVVRRNDVVSRDGEAYVRGGRAGEIRGRIDGVNVRPLSEESMPARESNAARLAPPPAAESGGTANPNGRPYDLVYHEHYGVNPFVAAEDDALSTFAVDVDDASWAVARRYLRDGNLPPKEAVRLEEFVNAFAPGWPAVESRDDFAIRIDGAPSRFGEGYHLLRVGIQGREITAAQRRPADLIFVIDISGSMERENRLGLVKQALHILVDELREGDRVGIVVYGSEARLVLEPVGIEHRTDILAAIDGLATDGATNAEAGLRLAYGIARRAYDPQAINRLILCSDGVANVGETGADGILESVRHEADRGIQLTTVGFGMGNYNDVLMEKLADHGDGTYHYVDRLDEAERVFRQNLTGTLQTLGRDAKVQVEFDPAAVDRWRLLGYENRDVADHDFRNDAVDAGEIGSGHTVVALYEVKLTDRGRAGDARLAAVRFRWEHPRHAPRAGQVEEIERHVVATDLAHTWDQAAPRLRLAATVAEFAEILRGSFWAKESQLSDLLPEADRLARDLEGDGQVLELRDAIRKAVTLEKRGDPELPPPVRD